MYTRTALLVLLLAVVAASLERPEPEFGAHNAGLQELRRRHIECRKSCMGTTPLEVCVNECIHPECAKQAKDAMDDTPDHANMRYHAEFRKCAQKEFYKDFMAKRGQDL